MEKSQITNHLALIPIIGQNFKSHLVTICKKRIWGNFFPILPAEEAVVN